MIVFWWCGHQGTWNSKSAPLQPCRWEWRHARSSFSCSPQSSPLSWSRWGIGCCHVITRSGLWLTPCLFVVSDQCNHCCVICILDDGIGGVPGHAVMSEQGIQEGTVECWAVVKEYHSQLQCLAKVFIPLGIWHFSYLLHYNLQFKLIFIWMSCNGHTQNSPNWWSEQQKKI